MENESRLTDHYNQKYSSESPDSILHIKETSNPKNRFEMVVHCASKYSGGRYLEIGAGSGNTLLSVIEKFDEIVATDLSDVRTQNMNKMFSTLTSKVTVVCNNIEQTKLDYPDNYFDIIVMSAVIEHLFDPVIALKETYRLLKPNGVLMIDTPNIAKWTRRIKLLFGYFPATASCDEGLLCYDRKTSTDLYDEGHLHYFTFRSLSRLCKEKAGFKHIDKKGYGLYPLCTIWPEMFSDIFIELRK